MSFSFFGHLADWEMGHRRWVFLALAAVTIASVALLTRLEFDFRPEALLQFSQEEEELARGAATPPAAGRWRSHA